MTAIAAPPAVNIVVTPPRPPVTDGVSLGHPAVEVDSDGYRQTWHCLALRMFP